MTCSDRETALLDDKSLIQVSIKVSISSANIIYQRKNLLCGF